MRKWAALIFVVLTVFVTAFLIAIALIGCATTRMSMDKIDKAQLDCFKSGCFVFSNGATDIKEYEWYCFCPHVIIDIEAE